MKDITYNIANLEFTKVHDVFKEYINVGDISKSSIKRRLKIYSRKFDSLLFYDLSHMNKKQQKVIFYYDIFVEKWKYKRSLEWAKFNFVVFAPYTSSKFMLNIKLKTNKETHVRKVIFYKGSYKNIIFNIQFLDNQSKESTLIEETYVDLNKYKDLEKEVINNYISLAKGIK